MLVSFQEFNLEIHQAKGMSGIVWEGALILSKFLNKNKSHLQGIASVVEVGGGTGMCGIALAKSLPHLKVTITDLPEALELIKSNVELNGVSNVQVETLDWFECCETQKFDLVIGSDVVYSPTLYEPLLNTLEKLTLGFVLLCNEIRLTWNIDFYKLAIEKGWEVTIMPEFMHDSYDSNCPVFKLKK